MAAILDNVVLRHWISNPFFMLPEYSIYIFIIILTEFVHSVIMICFYTHKPN